MDRWRGRDVTEAMADAYQCDATENAAGFCAGDTSKMYVDRCETGHGVDVEDDDPPLETLKQRKKKKKRRRKRFRVRGVALPASISPLVLFLFPLSLFLSFMDWMEPPHG
jgi:hypothetical protein